MYRNDDMAVKRRRDLVDLMNAEEFEIRVEDARVRIRQLVKEMPPPEPVCAGECIFILCGYYCDSPWRSGKFCTLNPDQICRSAVGPKAIPAVQ